MTDNTKPKNGTPTDVPDSYGDPIATDASPINFGTDTPSDDQVQGPATGWECPACQLANPPESFKCLGCGSQRRIPADHGSSAGREPPAPANA